MKYTKTVLITSIFYLFFINNHLHGQSKSKEELGNSLVESILSKNIESFKVLLLPKKVVLKLLENNTPENINKEERDSLMKQSESAYDNIFISQYENNFLKIVQLTETNKIDWSNLKFEILYKYSSKQHEYDPFLIHTRLINSDYNHFYFSAVRYKGKWFLEDEMEITKDEKYAPND
ncbi:MAG: hypothetical protein DRI95_10175 [Bacteroidetes bacterium]|nr:MAG: hypothetical protein DRI95_10175 [Bacteroidota bacterium]